MVKTDIKRDYYSDLELKPSAGEDDIKKQFRKLAMRYHPDRNPGKELEFNAKFQAIQAAHELLSDPAQKSQYDTDRLQAGLYNPYTSPTAPSVPPRSPYSNFPPPPTRRPAPPPASKTTFPQSPPNRTSHGAYRYANFATDEPSWSSSNDEAKNKTNAAKAWAHMKSPQNAEEGSFGKNTRHARANSFQNNAKADPVNPPKPRPRSGWEPFQDKPQGFPPGMARANTMRVPKKNGFAPATPGGDEPPARNTSSYFTSRTQPQYPPPPAGPPPKSRRPDPIRSETARPDADNTDPIRSPPSRFEPLYPHYARPFMPQMPDPTPATYRMSTPYATPGGERTHLSSDGLDPSTSSHHARNGWPRGYTPKTGSPLSPPGPGRHHSASPKMRSPNRPRESFSSTSSGSSDDDDERNNKWRNHGSARRASADHRPTTMSSEDGQRHTNFPSVKVGSDEKSAGRTSRSQHRSTWNPQTTSPAPSQRPSAPSASQPGSRRPSAGSDPEGHFQTRAGRDTERGPQLPKSPLHATTPWNSQTFEKPPLEKSRSWHEHFGSREEGNNQRQFNRPPPGVSKEPRPMYDSSEYTSLTLPSQSSHNQTLPDNCKPKTSSTPWPYWAIPSSVTPSKKFWASDNLPKSFHYSNETSTTIDDSANADPVHSFRMPNNAPTSTSPRKTQSSENIDTRFSPSDWHGKFNGDAEDYLGATRNGNVPQGRMSPPKGRPPVQPANTGRPKIAVPKETIPLNGGRPIPPPPPFPPATAGPPTGTKFSEEEWRKTFNEPHWAYPAPPPIQSPRMGNGKRSKPLRKLSTANKRPTIPKPAFVSPTSDGEDEGDASNEASSVLESDTSRSSGNAMDIDPALTPPSAPVQQTPIKSSTNAYTDPITNIIRSAVPPVSPSVAGGDDDGSSRLNLSDLKKQAPFTSTKSGLKDLNELKTSLPFPSAVSPIAGEPSIPQPLLLPRPPKAPSLPDIVNQIQWERYMSYMQAYMAEWTLFNKKMLAHFSTRQEEVDGKLGKDWMSRAGSEGYARYLKGVEEDFRVREHWDVSWEKHHDCMKGLGRVREKALQAKCTV